MRYCGGSVDGYVRSIGTMYFVLHAEGDDAQSQWWASPATDP
jgi:hypothetical protein